MCCILFKKIVYVLWVLANLYVIYSGGKTCYTYFMAGNTLNAVLTGLAVVGFTLLTAFIIYRDVKSYYNKKNGVKVYPYDCGNCKNNPKSDEGNDKSKCPNKFAEIKLWCGVDECKYWEATEKDDDNS